MKKFFLFSICLIIFLDLSSENIYSQKTGAVKGTVTDSITGESIPFATIQVTNTKIGTYSNANGFYYLQNIPSGQATIQATAVGYKKRTRTIKIEGEEPILLNFSLAPQPIELKAVTKTVERIKEIYETNISAQAITQEELKLIPLSVEKDLFRVLRVIPGISSTGDVTSQFYVRGGSGDQNLILIDNMMIYNPFHALGLFSIFNSDAIKVSEVLTGGFGPEFGGRLSSVINIITREGNNNKFQGKLNLGLLSGQGTLEGPILGGSFFTSYRKSYFDQILKKFLGKDVPLSFYDFSGKVTLPLSEEGRIVFSSLLSKDEILTSRLSEPNYNWDNRAIGLNIQTFLGNYLVNVSLSSSQFTASLDNKGQEGKGKSESTVSDFFFDAKTEAPLKNNDVISAGFSFIFPNCDFTIINNAGYLVHRSNDIEEENVWVKYKFTQIDKLVLNLGLRTNLEVIPDNMAYLLEPRLGMKYQITPDLALKGSYGRYHQFMATTSNEDDVIPLFESWFGIQSPFLPERSDEFVGGIDFNIFDNMNITLQGYYKRLLNLIGYNLKKQEESDPDFSSGWGKSYGVELTTKLQSEIIYGWFNYTLSWAKKRMDRLTFYPRYDKRHILNLILGAKLPYDFNFNVHWEISSGSPFSPIIGYRDRMSYNNIDAGQNIFEQGSLYAIIGPKNAARLPWYHKLDISILKSFNLFDDIKINTSLDIINIYNHKNIFYFNKETGESIYMLPFLASFSLGISI